MSDPRQNIDVRQLAIASLAYLRQEHSLLTSMSESIDVIKSSILARQTPQLFEAVDCLRALQHERAQLNKPRNELRRRIADILAVPLADSTISLLAFHCDTALKTQLLTAQHEVRMASTQVSRKNRINLAIISRLSLFSLQIFERMTGKPLLTRYGKSGQLDQGSGSPLFQTDY